MRPAPDTMAYLTALLPAKEAVAVFKALHDAAATARAVGDERSSDQVKADTLVQRVTGQASAAAVPLEIGVVITDTSLIGAPDHGSDHTAAHLEGYGPIPAADVRRWLNEPASRGAAVWVRRLFTDPVTDLVTTVDPKRRRFPCAIRDLVVARDQWCRTPWCGAPIRHTDHAKRWAGGGETTPDNAQGLCERCNHAKEAVGWATASYADPLGQTVVVTRTPTGAIHRSVAPPALPGWVGRPRELPDPREWTEERAS
jgi:5-methylcytosine-specific restriction endonuclease McrA